MGKRLADALAGVPEKRTRPCAACKRHKVRCVYTVALPCERCVRLGHTCLFDGGVSLPSIRQLPAVVPAVVPVAPGPVAPDPWRMPMDNRLVPVDSARGAVPFGTPRPISLTAEEELRFDALFPHKRQQTEPVAHGVLEPGVLDVHQAQELFSFFDSHILPQLFGFAVRDYAAVDTLPHVYRECPVMVVVVCYIASVHHPRWGHLASALRTRLDALVSAVVLLPPTSPQRTLHTIVALCLAGFWVPEKHLCLGVALQLAHQIDLPGVRTGLRGRQLLAAEADASALPLLDRAKVWYLVYILDGHASLAHHQAPLVQKDQAVARSRAVLLGDEEQPAASPSHASLRLVSQLEYNQAIREALGARPDKSAWSRLLNPARFGFAFASNMALDRWMVQWTVMLRPDAVQHVWLSKSTLIYYNFAKMYLNLREEEVVEDKRPPSRSASSENDEFLSDDEGDDESTVTTHTRDDLAVAAARTVLLLVLTDSDIAQHLKYVPVHIHMMLFYALTLLLGPRHAAPDDLLQLLKQVRLLIKVLSHNPPIDAHLGSQLLAGLHRLLDETVERIRHEGVSQVEEVREAREGSDSGDSDSGRRKIMAWPGLDHGHPSGASSTASSSGKPAEL